MASSLVDLVKITVNSTGTGSLALGEAVRGYRGTEALTNGAEYSYSIQQAGSWEFGRGVFMSPGQFTRSVIGSSEGGVPINLQSFAQVSFTALAEDLLPVTLVAQAQEAAQQAEDVLAGVVTVAVTTEALAAKAFVNIFDNAGVPSVRNASAADPSRFANGFVNVSAVSGALATISVMGINRVATTGFNSGEVWLSNTTPGGFSASAPTSAGSILQPLGTLVQGVGIIFVPQPRILL